IRLSGPTVRSVVSAVVAEMPDLTSTKRKLASVRLRIPGVHSLLDAQLLFSPAPQTYTGQDTAELHTISSPPLLDALIASLLNAGARAALPGEFTMRAFLAGKKDL